MRMQPLGRVAEDLLAEPAQRVACRSKAGGILAIRRVVVLHVGGGHEQELEADGRTAPVAPEVRGHGGEIRRGARAGHRDAPRVAAPIIHVERDPRHGAFASSTADGNGCSGAWR